MDTSKLIQLPIKSLNIAAKLKLAEVCNKFEFNNKGCLFNGIYYDFRVSRVVSEGILLDSKFAHNIEVHINQIQEDDILLAVIFKEQIRVYLLERSFFKEKEIQKRISYQHKNKYHQLHVSIEMLENLVKEKFDV
jgi:hypothetical protein